MKLLPARILHFDIENRPLSYWYDGRCTGEVTAVAWSWADDNKVDVALLGTPDLHRMVLKFLRCYEAADIVTGHYIRKHDLPILVGGLVEVGAPILPQKLTSDTKLDLITMKDLPASQEALSAYFGLKTPKIHMTQHDWREANRLTQAGIDKTRQRVVVDVLQHKELRWTLLKHDLLGAPKMWKP